MTTLKEIIERRNGMKPYPLPLLLSDTIYLIIFFTYNP